jgi:outer membrane protein OmpA-like peptidoglycan-associated protein
VHHPRRFFRSSLLTAGALAAGTALAVPASASADAPVYPPAFAPAAAAVAQNQGEHDVRLFHGLPTGDDDGVVRVDVAGTTEDDGVLRFAEFRPSAGRTTLEQFGTQSAGTVERLLFAGAGHLNAQLPDATAVVAVVRRGVDAWEIVAYGAAGNGGVISTPLPGEPTGLAVGRFGPGAADTVAVSLATGETQVYGYGGNPATLAVQAVIPDLQAPLGSWPRYVGSTELVLGGSFEGQSVFITDPTGSDPGRTPMPDAPPLAAMQATGAQDLDRRGLRWATVPSSVSPSYAIGYGFETGAETAFEGSIGRLNRAATARFGRNGAGRDTVLAVGDTVTRVLGPYGEDDVVEVGGAEGTVVDVDQDGRDDLVTTGVDQETGGTTLAVHRNVSGDAETRAVLSGSQFSPALGTNDHDEPATTATSLTWTPQDGAEYRCALDGADAPAFQPCGQDGFDMVDLQTGGHRLRVERRQNGMTFWAPVASLTFAVQPEAPVVAGPAPDPHALPTKDPSISFVPHPGSTLECRSLTAHTDWASCANPFGADLPSGDHEIAFRWVDGHGVPSDAFTWKVAVDRTAPGAPHVFGRPVDTTSTAVSIGFTVDADATAECRVDDEQDFTACAGPILELTGLKPGPHKVEIRQTDQAGNTSDVELVEFAVVAPHAPTIVSGPTGDTDRTDADFVLGYDDPDWSVGALECALDGADFASCEAAVHVAGLAPGAHVLRARQTVDGTNHSVVSERRWTVTVPKVEEPTGPRSGDAPAEPVVTSKPVPAAPVPAAAPKPAAPQPGVRLETPAAPVKARSATVTGRALNVGCAVPGATSYRCEITVSKAGRRLGHAVRTGDGTVQVKLTREGARKVQRLGGLTVRVKVQATNGGTTTTTTKILVVPTDGLFAFDSAKPSAAGTRLAATIASQLFGARELTIVGHTDSKGTEQVNQALGLKRARAFAALLRSEGLGDTRVVVKSAGEGSPRTSNDTARGQQLNRRVEVTVRY